MTKYTIEEITSSSMGCTVYDLYKDGYMVDCYDTEKEALAEKQKLENKELN